tara:strand:+ start:291 stop:812 length:522 start_codon:yes stop_codon:yes gene_type:complete
MFMISLNIKSVYRCFIALFICFSVFKLEAQSISRYSITPFVNEGVAYGMKLNGHLGEVAVSTMDNGLSIVTQGFQQPSEVYGLGLDEQYTELDVKVFPNITNHSVKVLCAQTSDDLKLHLFDSNGRLLFVKNIQSGGQSDVLLSALSDGVYFASFVSENYRKKKTVKIIKTNK